MLATPGDKSTPTDPRLAPKSEVGAGITLPLVWLGQILIPLCLAGYAFIESFHLPEADPPPPAQLDRAHAASVALAIVVLVIPAVGCVVAASTKHRVQAWAFGIIFALALIIDGGVYALQHRSRPAEPVPAVTHCIPRSDGGHGCPGG